MTLNPKEAPAGYMAAISDCQSTDCELCAFGPLGCSRPERNTSCVDFRRNDRCNVYFIKLPKKLKKPKPAKPRRKAHVVWVYTTTDKFGIVVRCTASSRRRARVVMRDYADSGWTTRGPVKAVLP